MKLTSKLVVSMIVAGGVCLTGAMAGMSAEPAKTTAAAAGGPAKIGEMAPAFTLTDTAGKAHNLADYKGKIVVLEWFNPECPFIVKHHKVNKTFNDLNKEYSAKNVVFIAINSSAEGKQGYGKELNTKMAKEFGMEFPICLDADGTVGRQYGAKTTPHVFVIAADGKLAYQGAVCNNPDAQKVGDKNYVKMALDQLIRGETVTTAETRPYGCNVKFAK